MFAPSVGEIGLLFGCHCFLCGQFSIDSAFFDIRFRFSPHITGYPIIQSHIYPCLFHLCAIHLPSLCRIHSESSFNPFIHSFKNDCIILWRQNYMKYYFNTIFFWFIQWLFIFHKKDIFINEIGIGMGFALWSVDGLYRIQFIYLLVDWMTFCIMLK